MVKKVLQFFSQESNHVASAALVIGICTLISQLFALVRDRLLAHIVGPGMHLDVYYASFRLPDFLYVSIASLASITVLLPFLNQRLQNDTPEGRAAALQFFSRVFSALSFFLIAASIGLFFLLPIIAPWLAPGFDADAIALLITTSRILLISPILFGISNMLGAATQMFRNFTLFALAPILYNVGIIIGIIVLYPLFGVYGLASGVILGAFFHAGIQIPYLIRKKFLPGFVLRHNFSEIISVMRISLPRTLGLAAGSVTLLVFVSLISTLGEGAISLFQFAQNLQAIPVAIIGASFSVASFPTLVQLFQKGDTGGFRYEIGMALRTVLFWTLPVAGLFIVLRAHIVRIIYGAQTLSWNDTRLVAALLALFVFGIIAQNIVLLFTRSFYAASRTRIPLGINIISECIKIALAIYFLKIFVAGNPVYETLSSLMRITDIPGRALLAFPVAYSIGAWINVALMITFFRKSFGSVQSHVPQELWKGLLGTGVLCIGTWMGLRIFNPFFADTTFLGVLGQGTASGILGVIFGSLALSMVRSKEFFHMVGIVQKKFWRTHVVTEEQTDIT